MREIQCKRCFFFTPEWCPKKRDSLDPDLIHDCQYFRIKTNADRIRSMTDEELAKYLAWLEDVEACYQWEMYDDADRITEWLEWLKQEAAGRDGET